MHGKFGKVAIPVGLLVVIAAGAPGLAGIVSDLEVHYEFERLGEPAYNSVGINGVACGA